MKPAFADSASNYRAGHGEPAIFRGGRTYAEVGRAKAQVRAGENELLNTEENVLLNAVTAYMDVVRDEATS